MSAGRPPNIETPEEFEQLAEAYFAECTSNEKPITITGLALACGLWGRDGLTEYDRKPAFSAAVKRAKARVEQVHEERLQGTSPTGSIFWLKNYGWRDQQDLKHSGDAENPVVNKITWEIVDPA